MDKIAVNQSINSSDLTNADAELAEAIQLLKKLFSEEKLEVIKREYQIRIEGLKKFATVDKDALSLRVKG